MTTSGSIDFEQSAIEIIKDALILVNGIADEETPSGAQTQYCMRQLNRMVKAWSKKGLKIWNWNSATLTLVVGQESYTIGPGGNLVINRPLEIENARRVVSSIETPIEIVARSTYQNQSQKENSGKPVMVYYDSQMTQGVMYVWPSPDATDTIKFDYKSYIQDFDATTNTPHFPVEWTEALVWGLALRIMPKYEVSGEDKVWITQLASQFLNDAETNDTDDGSVYLMPEARY